MGTRAFFCSALLFALISAGCAAGSGRGTPGRRDAGGVDAGGGGTDSGLPEADSGPRDAGPPEDTGPLPDTGPICSEFEMLCGADCANLDTDERHCGSCDTACAPDEECIDAVCTPICTSPEVYCSGECVDVLTDVRHCGGCDMPCAPGETCVMGVCQPPCAMGLTYCPPDCVDTATDEMHCGACDVACAPGETCLSGVCTPSSVCSGGTAAAWEAIPGFAGNRGLQAFVPSGERFMYVGSGGTFLSLELATNTWTTLAAAPSLAGWGSPALSGGAVWELRENNVVRYDIATNTWTTPRSDLHMGSDQHAQTVTDRDGALWSMNGLREIVKYDPATDTASYFPSGVGTDLFETRVTYDESTHSIYFGGFGAAQLYRFDIGTSAVTTLAPHPEGSLSDVFCGDRCGHIYAAGGSSGMTMWQYEIATDTWSRIPDMPVDHAVNASCGVVEDGWLYVEYLVGGAGPIYRIGLR